MRSHRSKTVFVLDAGGTNFKFSAMSDWQETIEPFTLPAASATLDEMIQKIITGFEMVREKSQQNPDAISFCFPGPADYVNGIIGDLENLPLCRGGVPLKKILENKFQVPVYINNDGDLFAYSEALYGLLPKVNHLLEQQGNPKRYKNLLGITLGTGFGGGIVIDGVLLQGDNSAGGEINRMANVLYPQTSIEDSVTIRAIRRVYAREANIAFECAPEPFEIYEIAMNRAVGNQKAALAAWDEFAVSLADALVNAVSLVDGLVAIGGGLSGAWPVFLEKMVNRMNEPYVGLNGNPFTRMEVKAFNLESEADRTLFLEKTGEMIAVPFSNDKVWYNPTKKIGIGVSHLGTSSSVTIGAYAFALHELEKI
ncbi:MAG: ROK family protein [Lentimicrobiaceae bacterium]|jgi:glucokinase|nr:ROK family protein [Lentimicrobiaceae bacterium]